MDVTTIKKIIAQSLSDAQVQVESEDNVHFATRVVSEQFSGKTMIERHRMIHQALGAHLQSIHALAIHTYTPEEWQSRCAE